jgi:hypothetical protein
VNLKSIFHVSPLHQIGGRSHTSFFTQFKPYFGSTTLILISLSFVWFGYALWSQATAEEGQGSLTVSDE